MKFDLSEGLSRHALEHLILPVITIDEYESKISDKRAVVIGFFVHDEAPANDLSKFIDRSSLPILDTEVSPGPTQDGFYITWVELRRSQDLPTVLIDLLSEVENLCQIKEWQFTCPKHESPIDLDKKSLTNYLILDQNEVAEIPTDKPPLDEDIKFWQHAPIQSIQINQNVLRLTHKNTEHSYIISESQPNSPILPDCSHARHLQNILGTSYAVYAMDNGFLIECGTHTKFIQPMS